MSTAIPTVNLLWRPARRIISTRFPSVGILDRLCAPKDLDDVVAIESLTNPRLRQELGLLAELPPDQRVVGPGATVIMAAFMHPSPEGSRFSDGRYGVFYAAHHTTTAIAEVRYHRERFLAATAQRPQTLEMMLYEAQVRGTLKDIRSSRNREWYDPASYAQSQVLGAQVRERGAEGIVYRSVRDSRGECVAVFQPRCVSRCRSVQPIFFHWDGAHIARSSTPIA